MSTPSHRRFVSVRAFPSLAAGLLVTGAAVGQSFVTPSHFQNVEGRSYENAGPVAGAANHRFLQVYGELQGTQRTITALRFRRDGASATTSTVPAYTMLCDLIVSTAVTTPSAPSATYDSNHGTDRTVLGTNVVLQFPSTGPGIGPREFEYRIPLPRPHAFAGAGAFCFEMIVRSNTAPSGIYIDGVSSSSTNPAAEVYVVGAGCRISGSSNRASLSGYTQQNWTQGTMTWNLNGSYLPPNALVYVSLGVNPNTFGGLPLPLELPGTASASSGACTIYHDSLLQIPQLTNASGQLSGQIPISINLSMNGGNVWFSGIAVDPQANSWGLVLTNALRFELLTPYTAQPIAAVYGNNLAATGTAFANRGAITRFD